MEELEGRGPAHVGDRRLLTAHEALPGEEERVERLERRRERSFRIGARLLLELVRHLGRRDLAGVLAEAERRIRRAGEQRVERADQVEHRAVDHRTLPGIGRVEAVEAVLVAEVLHDRAALPERALREPFLLEKRRQVGGVLGEEARRRLLAPDVDLLVVETRRPHEDADGQIVHARLEDAQRIRGHRSPFRRATVNRLTATHGRAKSLKTAALRPGRFRH